LAGSDFAYDLFLTKTKEVINEKIKDVIRAYLFENFPKKS
jgi:hypothetical protein